MSSFVGTRAEFTEFIKTKPRGVVIKFTATWCGPCKKVQPLVKECVADGVGKFDYYEIDIDESIDVYAFMKSKRMISGVPTLMFYSTENKTFAPTISITGSGEDQVRDFFETINDMTN